MYVSLKCRFFRLPLQKLKFMYNVRLPSVKTLIVCFLRVMFGGHVYDQQSPNSQGLTKMVWGSVSFIKRKSLSLFTNFVFLQLGSHKRI